MKVKITIFAAMLLLCNIAYGQVSKEAYEKAVDYLNCKSVELSFKKDSSPGILNDYRKEVPCDDNISFDRINLYLVNTKGYERTVTLSKQINALKGDFKPNWKVDNAVEYLSETAFKDESRYKALHDFASDRANDPDFVNFKTELKKSLTDKLSVGQTINEIPGPTVSTKANVNNTSANAGKNIGSNENLPSDGWFSWTNLIFIFAFFLMTAAIGVLFTQIAALREKLSRPSNLQNRPYIPQKPGVKVAPASSSNEMKELKDNFNKLKGEIDRMKTPIKSQPMPVRNVTPVSFSEIDKLKDEILGLKREIELKADLRGRLDELKNEVESLKTKIRADGLISAELTHQVHEPPANLLPSRHEVFYFSTPNEDGSFSQKSAHSSYRENVSIYKFTKTSSNEAEFEIDGRDSSVKLALEYPDKNIDPVCEAQNAFNPKASRIITLQGSEGRAVLDGEKWKVTRKAKIKYEY